MRNEFDRIVIGGGAAGTAAPTGPLQGPEQERKGER